MTGEEFASRLWAVVPAAGSGQRFGGDGPKQYQTLAGRCVLAWSLDALLETPSMQGVVVALSPMDDHWPFEAHSRHPRVYSCLGGVQRAGSVLAGLYALSDIGAGDAEGVLVHDAARPAIARADIERLLRRVGGHPHGGLLAVPVADTLKRACEDERVEATVDRQRLWSAQTPQYFPLGALRSALEAAARDGVAVTDEAEAMERQGCHPRLVAGDPTNIKLTRPADRDFLEAVLSRRLE